MAEPEGPAPDAPAADWASVRKRVIRGSVWWAGIYPFQKGLQMGSNVLLASLLSPAAFGVVALGGVVVRAITMFSEVGIRFSLIQNTRDDDRFVNTAWTMQVFRGLLVALAALLLARPMAAFYDEELLRSIVPAIGAIGIVAAFQSTNYVTLNRTLHEKPRALLELANVFVTRGAMIVTAFLWPSAWALVVGTFSGALFFTTATHMLPGRRNRFTWDRESALTLIKFGKWVFVGGIIAFLGLQMDKLILGRLVSQHLDTLGLLGVYVMAQRVARLPVEASQLLGGQMAFPVLAEVRRTEPDRFEERLRKIRRLVLIPGVALCLGVVVLAPGFFTVFYDDRYAAARWMAPLITLSAWLGLLDSFVNKALLSLGRTRALALTGAINVVVSAGASLLGFHLAGVPGFIVGLAVGSIVHHTVDVFLLAQDGIRVGAQDIRFSLLFLLTAGTCAFCGQYLYADASAWIRYGVGLGIPLAIFGAVCAWAGQVVWRVVKSR